MKHKIVKIMEDCVGVGNKLGFPNIQTCTAVVAVLSDSLVGAHFTADIKETLKTETLCNRVREAIGGRPVTALYIVGRNRNHNPKFIAEQINCGAATTEAYELDGSRYGFFKNLDSKTPVFLFFEFVEGAPPQTWFKRDAKVEKKDDTESMVTNWLGKRSGGKLGYDSTITTQNIHELGRRHFTQL